MLASWRGYLGALLLGALLGVAGANWLARQAALAERLAAERQGRLAIALMAAASEAGYRAALAARDRALAAVEVAAAETLRLRDALDETLEELRHAPPEDDRVLSPTAQHFFDRLRNP